MDEAALPDNLFKKDFFFDSSSGLCVGKGTLPGGYEGIRTVQHIYDVLGNVFAGRDNIEFYPGVL